MYTYTIYLDLASCALEQSHIGGLALPALLTLCELLPYALLGIGERITGTRRGRNYRVHPQVILAAGA